MRNVSIVLPSFNPSEKIIDITKLLIEKGFTSIIVVDDGSNIESKEYFDILQNYKECKILRHYKNYGKGRALKTAFNYYFNNYPDNIGVITIDDDNQHSIEDICKCSEQLLKHNNKLILGCRNFNEENIPFKSRMGNKITRFIFKVLCGIKVSDTQTGLRAIPNNVLLQFLDIEGERYEYETEMLIQTKIKNIQISEINIQTIYIDNNSKSHYNPLKDSLKIYKLIFKYISISIFSALIDLGVFTVLVYALRTINAKSIFISTLIARIISSLFNFNANKKIVFNCNKNTKKTMLKYYILLASQMFCSFIGVYSISSLLFLNTTFIKIIVDILLALISFNIQREWVFKVKK